MNFLKYIELSAENLQFYLWYRDYSKRFDELPASEKALSPEWIAEKPATETKPAPKAVNAEAAAILEGTDFGSSDAKINESEKAGSNPFYTPPRTPTSTEHRAGGESFDSAGEDSLATGRVDHTKRAEGAFEGAGLKWKPRKLWTTFVLMLCNQLLILHSLRSAISRGDQSHHLDLHCRWWFSSAQPVVQGAYSLAPRSSKHHPSLCFQGCNDDC